MDVLFWIWIVTGYFTLFVLFVRATSGQAFGGSPYRIALAMPGMISLFALGIAGASTIWYAPPGSASDGSGIWWGLDQIPDAVARSAPLYGTAENLTFAKTLHGPYTAGFDVAEMRYVPMPHPTIWGLWHYGLGAMLMIYVLMETFTLVHASKTSR